MSKKDNKLNLYEVTGPFRVLLKNSRLFVGEIKGAWDDAILLNDPTIGDCIIYADSIAVMMEGLEPPKEGGQENEKDVDGNQAI